MSGRWHELDWLLFIMNTAQPRWAAELCCEFSCCDQGFSVWPPDGQSVSTVLSFFLNFLVKTQQDEHTKRKKRFRFRFKRVKKKSKMHFFHIKINSMSYDL